MISKYGIFMKVIETGSFTKAAALLGYSQSAVSQAVKTLEQDLNAVLVSRKRDGVALTSDGQQFLPYIQAIANAEEALGKRSQEMQGLENSTIRIGTFTSVSRTLLPQLMSSFKRLYPKTNFILRQGEYSSISQWIEDGSVDFGFVNKEAVSGLVVKPLYKDKMLAVLPPNHDLGAMEQISLTQLTKEPFILLDEGEYSLPLNAFREHQLEPRLEYTVYDDYTILAMIRQGLGVSLMYKIVLEGFEAGLTVRPLREQLERTVALAWKNWDTMPYAARCFIDFIQNNVPKA